MTTFDDDADDVDDILSHLMTTFSYFHTHSIFANETQEGTHWKKSLLDFFDYKTFYFYSFYKLSGEKLNLFTSWITESNTGFVEVHPWISILWFNDFL